MPKILSLSRLNGKFGIELELAMPDAFKSDDERYALPLTEAKYDGSIETSDKFPHAIEYITPPTAYEDVYSAAARLCSMYHTGKANRSTGLHVHIGLNPHFEALDFHMMSVLAAFDERRDEMMAMAKRRYTEYSANSRKKLERLLAHVRNDRQERFDDLMFDLKYDRYHDVNLGNVNGDTHTVEYRFCSAKVASSVHDLVELVVKLRDITAGAVSRDEFSRDGVTYTMVGTGGIRAK